MESLLRHCSAIFFEHGSIFAVFFMGGLMGSLTHCLTMCGSLLACQAACAGKCGNPMSVASQWQYHAGRLLVYGLFGFFASFTAKLISAYSFWPTLSACIMLAAGVLFLASGIFPRQHKVFEVASKNIFFRGVLMSFMPCGLLYAALMMAATIANPLSGMIGMWFFVLGTLPALLTASGSVALLARKWQYSMGHIGRIGLTFNGLTLIAMAARIAR